MIRVVQDIYSKILKMKIDIPRVVVIGPQSSGKSSVLEQILQFEILPRGINMVTKCPIVMHLRNINSRKVDGREVDDKIEYIKNNNNTNNKYVTFEGDPTHYSNPKIIHDKILEKMPTISKDPVVLYVYLENTLEMTLVDLPGLTKVPVGSQPKDIERQIEEIVLEYSTGDSTIILAVINANVDIGTSEALKMAKRVDKGSKRTLGVLTKIDLMDKGTDCTTILRNEAYPLHLGYIGVLNKSFQGAFGEVKRKEKEFFGKEPYAQFKGRIGSDFLLERLHDLFRENVEKKIPTLRKEIKSLLREKKENPLVDYYYCLQDVVGYPLGKSKAFSYSGENVLYEFKRIFDRLLCTFDFTGLERDLKSSDSLIFPEHILKDLVRRNSGIILKGVVGRISHFLEILKGAIMSITSDTHPTSILNKKIISVIEAQEDLLMDDLKKYITIQSHYINPRHPDFFTPTRDTLPFNDIQSYMSIKKKIKEEEETIIQITEKYLEKIKVNFLDHALKSIYFYFIHYLRNESLRDILTLKNEYNNEKEIEELEGALKLLGEF